MSNLEYIIKKLQKNETIYLLNDFEEIVVKLIPNNEGYQVIAKFKGESKAGEYEVERTSDLSIETRLGGKIITKKEYDEY